MQRLLRDLMMPIIEARTATEIVRDYASIRELEAEAYALAPDLIIISRCNEETKESLASILKRLPPSTVIAISNDGRKADIYRGRGLSVTLTDYSVQGLLKEALKRG